MGRKATADCTNPKAERVGTLPRDERLIGARGHAGEDGGCVAGVFNQLHATGTQKAQLRLSACPPLRLCSGMDSPIMLKLADRIGQEIGLSDWVTIDQA